MKLGISRVISSLFSFFRYQNTDTGKNSDSPIWLVFNNKSAIPVLHLIIMLCCNNGGGFDLDEKVVLFH